MISSSLSNNNISLFQRSSSLFPCDLINYHSMPTTVFCCMSSSLPNATHSITSTDRTLLQYKPQPVLIPCAFEEGADGERREYLLEQVRKELYKVATPVEKLKLIDDIQRLGISYYLEKEIATILQEQSFIDKVQEEDLFTTGLRFRILRHNGYQISPDIFKKFKDKNGKFTEESLHKDILGLLSLYEASYMGAKGEEILEEAMEFTKTQLTQSLQAGELTPDLKVQVAQALELPSHQRMAHLEARSYIGQYSTQNDHNPLILELAKLYYNIVQSLHQTELDEITRWWKELGLIDKLSFARDRFFECFIWIVGLLPEPKYSKCRIELAKTLAIMLVIDDVFDTYGRMEDLILFTAAIKRWDLEAIENLPEYMKICYMALYNLTNEICYKVLKENGWNVLPHLKSTWIDMIEGYMVEAKWFNGGTEPNLKDYIENAVSTSGSYMALVHLFFLIGEGVTEENAKILMKKPYPKLFYSAGRILRLWNDLGTAKEEVKRGDLASSIYLLMKEKNIKTEEECKKHILEDVYEYWKDLNGELNSREEMPLSIIKVALNMARASQVVYKHEEESYLYSVENYVQVLYFSPIA